MVTTIDPFIGTKTNRLMLESELGGVATLLPSSTTQNMLFRLPPTSGSPNQTLITDGNGNLSWSAGSGSVLNIAALRALDPASSSTANVLGYYSAGDGGGGAFYSVTGKPAGTYTDNLGTVIVPAGGDGSKAWLRLFYGEFDIRWFGAKGDGISDDTASIQAAFDSITIYNLPFDLRKNSRGGQVNIPPGRYRVTSTLQLRSGLKLVGVGSNESIFSYTQTSGSVLSFTDTTSGSIDTLLLQDFAVVVALGTTHSSGAAIDLDGAPGITPILRNIQVERTNAGIRLRSCYPAYLENVRAFSHSIYGFQTDKNCTSTTFNSCYAGAISAGPGFRLNGNYTTLVSCASDNNATYGYEIYYDTGSATGIELLGCGTEQCGISGILADRVIGLTISSPRILLKAGGSHGIQLLGTTGVTLSSPVISSLVANPNYAIYQASSGGTSASSLTLTGIPSIFGNFANSFNDTENVFGFGRSTTGSMWNGNFRLGGGTYLVANLARFHFGGALLAGSGGTSYGQNSRLEITSGFTLAATQNSQPVVNAPALTITELISGFRVDTPTIVSGTVTNMIGARIRDISGGGSNINLALGNALPPAGSTYNIYAPSTRENLLSGPIRWGSSTGPLMTFGAGSPEGVVPAPVGSTYQRTDGTPGNTFYVKETGTGNTGWTPK